MGISPVLPEGSGGRRPAQTWVADLASTLSFTDVMGDRGGRDRSGGAGGARRRGRGDRGCRRRDRRGRGRRARRRGAGRRVRRAVRDVDRATSHQGSVGPPPQGDVALRADEHLVAGVDGHSLSVDGSRHGIVSVVRDPSARGVAVRLERHARRPAVAARTRVRRRLAVVQGVQVHRTVALDFLDRHVEELCEPLVGHGARVLLDDGLDLRIQVVGFGGRRVVVALVAVSRLAVVAAAAGRVDHGVAGSSHEGDSNQGEAQHERDKQCGETRPLTRVAVFGGHLMPTLSVVRFSKRNDIAVTFPLGGLAGCQREVLLRGPQIL